MNVSFDLTGQAPAVSGIFSHKDTHLSPGMKLFELLVSKGIIDKQGRLNSKFFSLPTYLETYKTRLHHFLYTERIFELRKTSLTDKGIGIQVKLTWMEVLQRMNATSAPNHMEILRKHTLYFLGFDTITNLCKELDIDLVKVCGPDYVELLRQEIETEPNHLLLQYFSEGNFIEISKIKDSIADLIELKFPFPFMPSESEYCSRREVINQALRIQEDTTFHQWLKDFANFDLYAGRLAARHLVLFKNKEPERKKINPEGSCCLRTVTGQTLEISISSLVSNKKIKTGLENTRLPIVFGNNEELQTALLPYEPNLAQGIIDFITGNDTNVFSDLSYHNWTQSLMDSILGQTTHVPNNEWKESVLLIARANEKKEKYKQFSLGRILGLYLVKTMKMMRIQEPVACYSSTQTALVLTMSACQRLKQHVAPQELQVFACSLINYWGSFKDDGSVFYGLACALKNGVPVQLILAYLELAAINQYQNPSQESPLFRVVESHYTRIRPLNPTEPILQLVLPTQTQRLFINFPVNQTKAVATVLELSIEAEKHIKSLTTLLKRLFPSDKEMNVWDGLVLRSLKLLNNNSVPFLFKQIYMMIRAQFNQQIALKHLTHFFTVAQMNLSCFKGAEAKESVRLLFEKLQAKRDANPFFITLLSYMATVQDDVLNKICYEIFKKEKAVDIKKGTALVLCGLPSMAVKTFWHMRSDPKVSLQFNQILFEQLCRTMRRFENTASITESTLYMIQDDMEAILSIPFALESAEWLAHQLSLLQFNDLAEKARACIKQPVEKRTILKRNDKKAQPAIKAIAKRPPAEASKVTPPKKISPVQEMKENLKNRDHLDFHAISRVLLHPASLDMFRSNSIMAWNQLILPVLQNLTPSCKGHPFSFFVACLRLFHSYKPEKAQLQLFITSLKDYCKSEVKLHRTLRLELKSHHSDLISQLKKEGLNLEIIELADLLLSHNIIPEAKATLSIASAAEQLLQSKVTGQPLEAIVKVVENRLLKQNLQQTPAETLSKIYLELSILHSKDFEKSFKAYRQHSKRTKQRDQKQLSVLLQFCTETNKWTEFAILTQFVSKSDVRTKKLWLDCFKKLFLSESDKDKPLQVDLIESLESILDYTPSSNLLKDETLGDLLFARFKLIDPHSPLFIKSKTCAFTLTSYGLLSPDNVVALYQSIPANSDLVDKAYLSLTALGALSREQKSQCANALLPHLKHINSTRFIEFLNNPKVHAAFDLNGENGLEFLLIMFEGIAENWVNNAPASYFKALRDLYGPISQKKWTGDDKKKFKQIELYYLGFQSFKEVHSKKQEEQAKKNVTQFIAGLKYLLSLDGWTPRLLDAFKTMVENTSRSRKSVAPFSKVLLTHPNHEAGIVLIKNLSKTKTDKNLKAICNILKVLGEKLDGLELAQYEKFNLFCVSFLPSLIESVTLFTDPALNLALLNCLSSPGMDQLCSNKSDEIFRAFENIYTNYTNVDRNGKLEDELQTFTTFLQNFPTLVKTVDQERIDKLLSQAFFRIQIVLNRFNKYDEFLKVHKLIQSAVPLWKEDEKEKEATELASTPFLRILINSIFHAHDLFKNKFSAKTLVFITDDLSKVKDNEKWKRTTVVQMANYFHRIVSLQDFDKTKTPPLELKELKKIIQQTPFLHLYNDDNKSIMEKFVETTVEEITKRTHKTLLEEALLLSRQPAEIVIGIDFLNNLLEKESPEISLPFIAGIIEPRIGQFFAELIPFTTLLKRVNEILKTYSFMSKRRFLTEFATIYLIFDTQFHFEWEKNSEKHHRFYDDLRSHFIALMIDHLPTYENLNNIGYLEEWIHLFNICYRCNEAFIVQCPKRLFPDLKKGLLAHEQINTQYLRVCLDYSSFETRAKHFVLQLNDYQLEHSEFNLLRADITLRWLSNVLKVGIKRFDPEACTTLVVTILIQAYEFQLIRQLPFDEERMSWVKTFYKEILTYLPPNAAFEKITKLFLDTLDDLIIEPKHHRRRNEIVEEWIKTILEIGKERVPEKTKPVSKRNRTTATKQGSSAEKEIDPAESYKLIAKQNLVYADMLKFYDGFQEMFQAAKKLIGD